MFHNIKRIRSRLVEEKIGAKCLCFRKSREEEEDLLQRRKREHTLKNKLTQ